MEMSIGDNDIKGLFDRVRNLEINDKVKDEKIDTLIGITRETLNKLDDHASTFKKHDEKEMKKYEETGKHITTLTVTVDKIAINIKGLSDELKKQDSKIDANREQSEKSSGSMSNDIKSIVAKQNRFLGGLGAIMFVTALVIGGAYFASSKLEERDKEIKELRDTATQLKINQYRNYERQKYIEKGIK